MASKERPGTGAAAQASHHAFVEKALEQLRTRLLDLTARNPLLNYRARKRDISVVDELPDFTFEKLLNGDIFTLDAVSPEDPEGDADPPRLPASQSAELPTPTLIAEARHRDDRLQTPFEPDQLESKCRSLRNQARTALEETGANFLFLVIGFLDWYESPTSDRKLRAPLVLVPVELQKGKFNKEQGCFEYKLSYTDEDIETNLSLGEKLRRDFELELPEFSSQGTPERYFEVVSELVAGFPRWRVAREMGLGLFSFSKILIYRDLDPERWPEGKKPADHPVVGGVIGGGEERGGGGLQVSESYDIDADSRADFPLILAADSSQHSALIDALCSDKSLVIHGPPGTGKSQTISNLIGAAMHQGLSVLFVAEKKAALEVVRRRLDEKGLGFFVLELHSHRAKKGQLHADLGMRLERSWASPVRSAETRREWESKRDLLREFSRHVLAPTEPDGEPFEKVVWRAGRHQLVGGVVLPPELARWNPLLRSQEIEELASLLREFAAAVGETPVEALRAWNGIDLRNATPEALETVRRAVDTVGQETRALADNVTSGGGQWEPRLEDLMPLAGASDRISGHEPPSLSATLWSIVASHERRLLVREAHSEIQRYRKLARASEFLSPLAEEGGVARVQALAEGCDELVAAGLAELEVADLEARAADAAMVVDALDRLASHQLALENLLRRPPSHLNDWARCLRLADFFARAPRSLEGAIPRTWLLPETLENAHSGQERSEAIRAELDVVAESVDLDLVPSPVELRQAAQEAEAVQKKSLHRLRSAYRRLKMEKRRYCRDRLRPTDPVWFDRQRRLASALEARDSLAEDPVLSDRLGDRFAGLRTKWAPLIRDVEWAGNFSDAAGDQFLAGDLLTSWRQTESAVSKLAASVSADVALVEQRIDRLLGTKSRDLHLGALASKAQQLAEMLNRFLPGLRAALSPAGSTPDGILKAALDRLDCMETEARLAQRDDIVAAMRSVWKGVQTETDELESLA